MTASVLTETTGRDLDLATLLSSVDQWTWMGMGVHANTTGWLVGHDHAQHDVRFGARRKARLVVKLNSNDLFDVEFGRVVKFDWKVLDQRHDVSVETLDRVLREMFDAQAV